MALASVPVPSDKIDTIGRRQKLCYPSRRENACTWWERTNLGLYCGLTSTLTDRSPPPGLTPWRVEWLDNPFCDAGYLRADFMEIWARPTHFSRPYTKDPHL